MEEVVRRILKWSADLKKPVPEDKLLAQWEAQVQSLSPKKGPALSLEEVKSATWEDVIVDNCRRIEAELISLCESIRKPFAKDARLAELKTLRPAVLFDDILRMKERCRVESEELMDRYVHPVSPTRELVDIEACISSQESALLALYRSKELRGLIDLDTALEQEITVCEESLVPLIHSDTDACLHMGDTVQIASSQCASVVLDRLCVAFGPLPALLQESYKSRINQQCIKFLIDGILPKFTQELRQILWTENYRVVLI